MNHVHDFGDVLYSMGRIVFWRWAYMMRHNSWDMLHVIGCKFFWCILYYGPYCIHPSYVDQSVDDLDVDVISAGVRLIKLSGGMNITCVLLDIVLEMASGAHSNVKV